MAVSAHTDRLEQFEEGNTAGGHAGEVEALPVVSGAWEINAPLLRPQPFSILLAERFVAFVGEPLNNIAVHGCLDLALFPSVAPATFAL
jgi:hypothetical protein